MSASKTSILVFQPTLPARGATTVLLILQYHFAFQPTLPARGATYSPRGTQRILHISTHAPRTGSDGATIVGSFIRLISTHAPRTGSDLTYQPETRWQIDFNPRSPHGERRIRASTTKSCRYFNPRSPHGERPARPGFRGAEGVFQPTLPARGATNMAGINTPDDITFQPTLPARGATVADEAAARCHAAISTHAPRTGSDAGSPSSST